MTTEIKLPVDLMQGAQADFYQSQAFSPAYIAGRGGGKTWGLVTKAMKGALDNPKERGCLTQPTFQMIRSNFMPVWEKQFGEVRGHLWEYQYFSMGTPAEIAFKNGFTYDLRPATNEQAEKFRGPTYRVVGMDEIRNEDQFQCYIALMGTLRQGGQFFVTSTPETRRPWIKKIWGDHVSPIDGSPLPPEDYPKFTSRMEDNWYLDPGAKLRLRQMFGNSRYGRQELDAEDVALEGAAFQEFGGIHNRRPSEDDVFKKVVYGIDFGATSPTAMYELKLDLSERVWITREFYMRNADDYDWIKQLAEWQPGFAPVYCDPSRSEKEMAELRRRYGVNLKRSTVKRFDDRVRLVRDRLALRDGTPRMYVDFGACPNLVSELNNLAFAQARVGEFAVDRWEPGSNDHAFDATCYGLAAFDKYAGPPPRIPVTVRGWDY